MSKNDSGGALVKLDEFVGRLNRANILHTVDRNGDHALVLLQVANERWEVEFFPNAALEVEIFRSDGTVEGVEALARLFDKFSDKNNV